MIDVKEEIKIDPIGRYNTSPSSLGNSACRVPSCWLMLVPGTQKG
jgi:hypothetical protein